MPQSVHKILIHESKCTELAPFSIEMLSEEAQGAKNKEYMNIGKIVRENYQESIPTLTF